METRYIIDKIKPAWDEAAKVSPNSFGFIYQLLCACYGHETRKYHTFAHIERCFREYDSYLTDTGEERSLSLDLGIAFHDIIYVPTSTTNETDSMDLMKHLFKVFGISKDLRDEVDRIIWITSTYGRETPPPSDSLTDKQKLMHDLDLSGFGLPWETFVENNKLVDEEFSVVPPEIYYPKRLEFLTRFSKRRPLFLTSYFRDKYENIAKDNLKQYIEELKEVRP